MVLWGRIKPSNLRCLSHQIRRSYFQISGSRSANSAVLNALIRVPSKPDLFLPKRPAEFACNSRFFGSRTKRKQQVKEERTLRTNDEITAEVVRIIVNDNGFTENKIVSRYEALQLARKLDLDLVEVQPKWDPPVCKVMDYHKEKYKKQVFEKERAKSKSKLTLRSGDFKVVRFSEKIDKNDLKNKANMVKRLMEDGHRVKCTVLRSKLTKAEEKEEEAVKKAKEEKKIKEIKRLLSHFIEMIDDVSHVEGEASVEKTQVCIIVRHRKFGPAKKSGKKKDSVSSPGMSTSSSTLPGSKMEDEIISVEDTTENRSAWTVSDANDDIDQVFDLSNDGHETEGSCDQEIDIALKAPLPVLNSKKASTLPSDIIENRYKRSASNNSYPPTKSRDSMDSVRLESQFPNQRKPSHGNDSLSFGDARRAGNESTMLKNPRLPDQVPSQGPPQLSPARSHQVCNDSAMFKDLRLPNQVPSQGPRRSPHSNTQQAGTDSAISSNSRASNETCSQSLQRPSHPGTQRTPSDSAIYRNPKAPNEIPNQSLQQPSHHHPSSPSSPRYGIFSAKKPDAARRQGMAAQGGKSQGGYPTDLTKAPKSDDSQRSGTNKVGTGKWGIFSGDGPAETSNRTPR